GLGGGLGVAIAHPAATNALRAQVSLPLPFTGGEWQETTQLRHPRAGGNPSPDLASGPKLVRWISVCAGMTL
ncbi:hypothetical protein DAH51_15040, partial [Sphingobium yanoikuyae]